MKKVKFNKKLQLNKETVANLNNEEMKNLKGGGPITIINCQTVLTICASCINTNCGGACSDPCWSAQGSCHC